MNYPTSPRKETSSVSKLTVEYLKKFGQNRDLQQYFVLSTPLAKSDENLNMNTQPMETKIPASILIGSKKLPLWSDLNSASTSRTPACEYQKTFDHENIDTGRLSSASSVISDKRLEWDSGADVGYVNYYNSKHKEKSLSLPALSTIESSRDNSLSSNSCASKKQTFVESTPAHTTGTNTHKFFQQNETEITAIPIENPEENVTNNLQKDKSVSLEDTRLKPESSPKKSLSQIDLSNIEKSSSVIENMYIFSPMFIKTLKGNKKDGETDKKSDKIIQTTLEKVSKLSSNTSDVALFESACDNDSSFSKGAKTNRTGEFSSRNKTNSGLQIPTSSSFEYIPGNKYNLSGFGASSSNENQASSKDNQNQVNTSDLDLDPKLMDINTSRSSNSSNHTQDSSGHSIGSILMASQYSTDLTKDLEHTVSAMRNIIEAKQYNEIDKKRLIRKIVKKIVNTHYDDDTVPQSPGPNPASHSSENDKISTNHSDSPPDNITSPTVLISKVHTRYSNNVSPEMISSPPLIEMDTSFKSDRIDEENVNNDDDADEEVPQQNLIEQVCWKKDITFSEQLFAERIKNLQIQRKRHHRDRDKKKKQRNIFTNVEELHKKFMSNDYG
ncbi:uncharacterized protein LOC123290647 [Chrysoperla carnea]|uniref:uncharacterized protein LOC123290647 n=1 Tax=Chrysoperla carnea TaxID=189513 RepID=UPI001D079A9C|nr:uncharacterized protein LOC123290647 [Chrysoperla carnea]